MSDILHIDLSCQFLKIFVPFMTFNKRTPLKYNPSPVSAMTRDKLGLDPRLGWGWEGVWGWEAAACSLAVGGGYVRVARHHRRRHRSRGDGGRRWASFGDGAKQSECLGEW